MPQNANDWANIGALVQIEAMYQGMHTVYEQSIQVVNFKMDYHFSLVVTSDETFQKQHLLTAQWRKIVLLD